MNDSGSLVLTVVDQVDNVPVVWWVDIDSRIAGMSRLCGAWVFDEDGHEQTLRSLTAARAIVATKAGQTLLEGHQIAPARILDAEATLTAVIAARDELQAVYEEAAASRRTTLTPPRWPTTLPQSLDTETASISGGDPRTSRALGIARWLHALCAAWDTIEEQRLARPYMRPVGGPTTRGLPVVYRDTWPDPVRHEPASAMEAPEVAALVPAPRTSVEDAAASASVPLDALEFVAFDVETANAHRGSICAIGAAVVRGGVVVSTHSWLVRPPAGLDTFDTINVRLHGITPDMVADQPSFAERLDQLVEVVQGLPLVAHNATFDVGALREACLVADKEWPTADYACSLILARRALDLISYRLPIVAAECGVDAGRHHEAGADARTCAQVVIELARRRNVGTLADLLTDLQVLAGRLDAAAWRGCHSTLGIPGTGLIQPETAVDADPEHPLYGRVLVFTGALSIRRQDAWDAAARCGAAVEKIVTKRTTMLVVGDGFTGSDPADFTTGKAAKAVQLRAKGQRIEVLTEADLVDLLAEARTFGIREAVIA
ncbi:exonuclease domain-containing protein [Modestobacter sp. VKM Ac-2978]|uniref:exonuclease domain-containing protein n=1 Tax=Modestobacter sp. VKM Ac-2978 TaxID=3004132 RepID=UPI0022A9F838|nr:exonuclease domain-containing protein [Modestobacter sp. VKM Ac-2978]MCZ2849154.1 exonuclease domain-containing protein [Modestobacter sp. VKM Ac-2978]